MAGQGPDRRQMLEALAKAAALSQLPGWQRWSFGGELATHYEHGQSTSSAESKTTKYIPQYFTPAEYETLDVLTEMIIPRDETPGAHDAGVSEFIDFMAAHGEKAIQKPMRDGLAWLDDCAQKTNGRRFVVLGEKERTALLEPLAAKSTPEDKDGAGKTLFALARRYTVMGFYTSRIGMQELNFPGLKPYDHSPECPHSGDPEHLHLPAAKF